MSKSARRADEIGLLIKDFFGFHDAYVPIETHGTNPIEGKSLLSMGG